MVLSYEPRQSLVALAAVFGDRSSIILILNAEAAPDVRDLQATTPLHLAALFATDADTTQALLDVGAKVQARAQFGDIPLH